MKKVIAFAESNSSIGLGHLVRTAQVLSCLDKDKFKIDFYCDYKESPNWLLDIEHKKISVNNFFKLNLNSYDLLIFDSYENREKLNQVNIKKLLIDDYSFSSKNENVDVILDWNFETNKKFYSVDNLILGTKFFPIGINTYPEFLDKSSWNYESKNILISLGGVSDTNLVNIEHYIKLANNYGKVYLMDPLSRLNNYKKNNIKLIQNESLSSTLNNYEFMFAIIAGGTSKYITTAYAIPSLLIPRNELESLLIDKFLQKELSFKESLLNKKNDKKHFYSELEKISINLRRLIDNKNSERINQALLHL